MTPEQRRELGLRAPYRRPTAETDTRMERLETAIVGHRFGPSGALIGLRRDGRAGDKACFLLFCTACQRITRFRSDRLRERRCCGLRGCATTEHRYSFGGPKRGSAR